MSDTSARLRAAVIGAGHLGRFHAQKYAALANAELIGVADLDVARAARVADECGCRAFADFRDPALLGAIDVASIAVPARDHHAIARVLLEAGVDVLVEKPIAVTVAEAEDLVTLAEARGRVLQVGHLERFNPAVLALAPQLDRPLFVESHRIAPYQPRGTDVSVVLDLMIHDIDLLLALVDAPVEAIDACGIPVLSDDIDIVNARLRFANGCTANVTASRVSAKSECKMRIFQRDAYFSLDLREKSLRSQRMRREDDGRTRLETQARSFVVEGSEVDALRVEIAAFLDAVGKGATPLVSGRAGLRALQTAAAIGERLRPLR